MEQASDVELELARVGRQLHRARHPRIRGNIARPPASWPTGWYTTTLPLCIACDDGLLLLPTSFASLFFLLFFLLFHGPT